jgi:prevent-host-death family protein
MGETQVGIREVRARLSEYVRRVKSGETIVITEHGQPVGRFVPAAASLDERLQALVRAGLAEWNGARLPANEPEPRRPGSPTVAGLLIDARA